MEGSDRFEESRLRLGNRSGISPWPASFSILSSCSTPQDAPKKELVSWAAISLRRFISRADGDATTGAATGALSSGNGRFLLT